MCIKQFNGDKDLFSMRMMIVKIPDRVTPNNHLSLDLNGKESNLPMYIDVPCISSRSSELRLDITLTSPGSILPTYRK